MVEQSTLTHRMGTAPRDLKGKPLVGRNVVYYFLAIAAHSPELTLLQQAEGKSEGCLSNLSASGGVVVSGRCGFTQRIRRGPGACSVEGRITRAGSSWHPQRWSTHPTLTDASRTCPLPKAGLGSREGWRQSGRAFCPADVVCGEAVITAGSFKMSDI